MFVIAVAEPLSDDFKVYRFAGLWKFSKTELNIVGCPSLYV